MLAAVATSQDPADPLSGLEVKEVPRPVAQPGWAVVRVRASSLNMHDVWTLRGVGHPADRLPIILGCDAAGVDEDGNEVVLYPIIADPDAGGGDETVDPNRALFSEQHDGTFAEYITVPRRNLLPKPASLSFDQAACLPVVWGTAYRMLFTQGRVKAGDRVLVQGAGGGVSTAAISLATAAGAVVYATCQTEEKKKLSVDLGARDAFDVGEQLPEKVDVVIETVGEATWGHSLRSLRPGGTVVICGATSGTNPPPDLGRVFYLQLRIQGSTGCTRNEFVEMLRMIDATEPSPTHIDRTLPLTDIKTGFQAMIDGNVAGKIVVHP